MRPKRRRGLREVPGMRLRRCRKLASSKRLHVRPNEPPRRRVTPEKGACAAVEEALREAGKLDTARAREGRRRLLLTTSPHTGVQRSGSWSAKV